MIWAGIALLGLIGVALWVPLLMSLHRLKYPEPHPSVIVHTVDNKSLEGVQMLRDGKFLLLGVPKMLGEGADQDTPLGGQVRFAESNISFVQETR